MTYQTLIWKISGIVSCLSLLTLFGFWYSLEFERDLHAISSSEKTTIELYDTAAVDHHIQKWNAQNKNDDWPLHVVPTGLFIQSIRFENAMEVSLTGYVWQKYTDGQDDGISRGFVFPESIDSADTAVQEEVYRSKQGNTEIVGWYFERILRQNFDYSEFPLDYKTIWIRMWHQDFSRNVVLVPDLEAYKATSITDIFGIDQDIVLSGWRLLNTYFSFSYKDYDTNFGLGDYVGQHNFPELHFQILVKRKILNALVIFGGPMLVVLALLFALLMATSVKEDSMEVSGFSIMNSYASYTALLFVVLLAHIDLREQYPVNEVFYIEYLYMVLYLIIILLTLNTHYCRGRNNIISRLLHENDHLMVKALFWPATLVSLNIITWIVMF